MPLVLQPSLDEHSREEIEAHVAAVQARRIVAAVEYQVGQAMKLEQEADKISRKLKGQYEMLAKELDRFDRADEALQKRLITIEGLKQERDLLIDMED